MTTTQSPLTCAVCDPAGTGAERVRYYPRQLLNADDLKTDQDFALLKQRRHNRFLHGFGVVCGFAVQAYADADHPWRIRVCPGYALSPQGEEIYLAESLNFDLGTGTTTPDPCTDVFPCPNTTSWPSPTAPQRVFLAIRHTECNTRPERVQPAGCGCSEAVCEYSRIRDAVELKLLWTLPASHATPPKPSPPTPESPEAPPAPAGTVPEPRAATLPNPACPTCYDDPWIVLAAIQLPARRDTAVTAGDIGYGPRRVLSSTASLQLMLMR